MSKFFIDERELERITFDDGEWVDIKRELTQVDSDYITTKMAKTKGGLKDMTIDVNLGNLPLMERSIVAWSFKDDSGQPVEVTSDNISNLRSKYRSQILFRINDLNVEARQFSKKS